VTTVVVGIAVGIAVGLIAYYHFGYITHYGFITNLVAIPVTALWMMPMGVLGTILIPFDLEY
jgi:competence protein ComEC